MTASNKLKLSKGQSHKRSNSRLTPNTSMLRLPSGGVNIRSLIYVSIVCALLALAVWWFRDNFERITVTEYELNTEAQFNSYYAAELLINQLADKAIDEAELDSADVDAEEDKYPPYATTLLDSNLKMLIDDLPELPDDSQKRPTLIINSVGAKLTDSRFQKLRQWIEQGGHVITFTSNTTSYEDMQAVADRLEVLKKQKLSPEQMLDDDELATLISQLNTGNQLLAKLGIFAVDEPNQNKDDDSDEDIEVQIEKILSGIEQQSNLSSQKDDLTWINKTLERLATEQPLTALRVQHDHQPADILMVQALHYDNHLDARLFEALYPDIGKVHYQDQPNTQLTNKPLAQTVKPSSSADEVVNKTNKILARELRSYLGNQVGILARSLDSTTSESAPKTSTTATSKDSAIAAQRTQSTNKSTETRRLIQLINAMLALSDERLLALFKPADDLYLEASLGQGRITVLIDNASMTNPNPSFDLPKDKKKSDGSVVEGSDDPISSIIEGYSSEVSELALITPLYELVSPGFRINLFNADNAAWLAELTADSSEVWILPNTDVEPLPVMLWKQARLAVLGLVLLSLLWLWSLYNRFGKLATLPTLQAHDIMRYFRQVGRYGWQQDHAIRLTRTTRERVRQQATDALATSIFTGNIIDAANNNEGSSPRLATSEQVVHLDRHWQDLHKLLLKRIDIKKQQLKAPQNSSAWSEKTPLNNKGANQLTSLETHYQLLEDNEDFIRALVTPDSLRLALAPTMNEGSQAHEFTQMTQTLWLVQWLLK